MQSQQKKRGVLRSWNAKRGFGIIRVGDEPSLERYFLHFSRIISGTAAPVTGMTVFFNVSSKTVAEGQLPMASEVDIDITSLSPANCGGAK